MGLDLPVLRRDTANYYNSISWLDSLVGDLLGAHLNSGKFDETLIVYLGDHGADLLRGKRTCYEVHHRRRRVPFRTASRSQGASRDREPD